MSVKKKKKKNTPKGSDNQLGWREIPQDVNITPLSETGSWPLGLTQDVTLSCYGPSS